MGRHGSFLMGSGGGAWLLRENSAPITAANQLQQIIDSMEAMRDPKCEMCGCEGGLLLTNIHNKTHVIPLHIEKICMYTYM